MHYHYFTLEQRNALADVMRSRLPEPEIATALTRLRSPDYGVCESCSADIPFVRLAANPGLRRCAKC